MTTTIGSGLGGFAAIAAQPTYGASFVTPTRTLNFKTLKMTYNTHPVQGGPYIRNGQAFDLGSARILTYQDASGTIEGDVMNTGHALLLATALGSSASLTKLSTTTAYELGGASGASLSFPDLNNGGASGCCFDMQVGVPTSDGTLHPENYHSVMIKKATWTFDRSGLTTYSYELDSQYVEKTTTLITPSFPTAPIPFSTSTASSAFKVGAYGSEAQIDGIRKVVISVERKFNDERIYIGNTYKDLPITNDNVKVTAQVDCDYTAAAKTAIFDLMLAGTPISLICQSVGNTIGVSGHNDTFALNITNAFVQTGGESPIDGPDLIKNTINLDATIDSTPDPILTATLITADTTF